MQDIRKAFHTGDSIQIFASESVYLPTGRAPILLYTEHVRPCVTVVITEGNSGSVFLGHLSPRTCGSCMTDYVASLKDAVSCQLKPLLIHAVRSSSAVSSSRPKLAVVLSHGYSGQQAGQQRFANFLSSFDIAGMLPGADVTVTCLNLGSFSSSDGVSGGTYVLCGSQACQAFALSMTEDMLRSLGSEVTSTSSFAYTVGKEVGCLSSYRHPSLFSSGVGGYCAEVDIVHRGIEGVSCAIRRVCEPLGVRILMIDLSVIKNGGDLHASRKAHSRVYWAAVDDVIALLHDGSVPPHRFTR